MSDGFNLDPVTGRLTVEYQGRTVQTTGGTLVCLLPELIELNDVGVTFPDPANRDYAYTFRHDQTRNILPDPDEFLQGQSCQTVFTRRPQEYEALQTLIAAPAGADIFVGQVRVHRDTAPSHTWLGSSLAVLVKQDEWMPWTGSALMEANLGLARAMHIFISGGELVLVRQMSISTPAGGYGTFGNLGSPAASVSGAEVLYATAPGLPVWTEDAPPYRKVSSRVVATNSASGPLDIYQTHRHGGSDPCSVTDPTDYTSIYSVDIRGRFGRRS